jgi:uncharacterized membrane protein YecN with MAPEG domain
MPWPHITAAYLAVLALIYCALAIHVVILRRRNRAAFGDADSPALRSAIRAHGHFAEYVPITALMVAMLEMAGAPAFRLHLLLGGLLLSRLMHPLGIHAKPGTLQFRFRVAGMWLTLIVLISAAVALLLRALRAG